MPKRKPPGPDTPDDAPSRPASRGLRADAQRNSQAILEAALAVFVRSGVDAPVREIADEAGVGVGTLYRHYPQRSDLIVAVFRNEVDACAQAASVLAASHPPGEALDRWLQRYLDFIAAKRGLGAALHSGDPAYEALPLYFREHLLPALRGLLEKAAAAGEIRTDIDAMELLIAIARLGAPDSQGGGADQARRMVALLIDGLRYGTSSPKKPRKAVK